MRGSLGVWAEAVDEPGHPPLPILDLHINVWRDLPGGRSSVDFGFQLSDLDQMRRMFLYIPAPIKIDEVEDLADVLKFGHTLSAVFNDTVEITSHNEGSFDIRRSDESEFRIFNLDMGQDIDIEYVPISERDNGSVLKFSEDFCNRLRGAPNGKAYFRMRVHLSPANGEMFYSYASPADSWLLSRFYRTELNEFRLNERRSFPDVVIKWSSGSSFRIRRVLYFLIRDFRYELLVQHTQFKRTRRLEPVIWQDYLAPDGDRSLISQAKDIGDRMLIYQWREDAPLISAGIKEAPREERKWIEDFSAFASFKSPKDNIWMYVLAILALGALGSALQASTLAAVSHFRIFGASAGDSSSSRDLVFNTFSCFAILLLVLVGLAAIGPVRRFVGRKMKRQ